MMQSTKCPRCGDVFEQKTGKGRRRKYCRRDCHHVTKECPVCGDSFRGPPEQKVCSYRCRNLSMAARNRSDPEAQSARGKIGGRVRAAQLTRSAGSYVKVDGRHEHRAVAEKVLGRALLPEEVVHHEDLDKHNNDPANLIVFETQAEHARHHKLDHLGLPACTCKGIRLKEVLPYEAP